MKYKTKSSSGHAVVAGREEQRRGEKHTQGKEEGGAPLKPSNDTGLTGTGKMKTEENPLVLFAFQDKLQVP